VETAVEKALKGAREDHLLQEAVITAVQENS
jgi:hypothetical protein